QKITVIYNGIDEENSLKSTSTGSSSSPDGKLTIACVANLRPIKGHRYLLEAISQVVKNFANVQLLLIGEDNMEGELQQLSQNWGIQNHVCFLGKRKDIPSLLQSVDLCVLPSLSEGMSNAILEYMRAGKAVVATRVGGNPELIEEGRTGLLVEAGSGEALANAINQLLADSDLRKRMGEAGRKRVEKLFSLERMVKEYDQLYRSIFT
ncbi:MAG: glycosyltransferase family 4 protein, partial [Candidatus Omnitrophica bacterium]|nr:glycosyltransferase family 4 protein [Candidatus Omnitrophota bacterium]